MIGTILIRSHVNVILIKENGFNVAQRYISNSFLKPSLPQHPLFLFPTSFEFVLCALEMYYISIVNNK